MLYEAMRIFRDRIVGVKSSKGGGDGPQAFDQLLQKQAATLLKYTERLSSDTFYLFKAGNG